MSSIMEAPAMLEDRKAPGSRRCMCLRVVFYALMLLSIVSVLVLTAFCLLHHQQVPGSCWAHGNYSSTQNSAGRMSWDWKLEHCNGMVQHLGEYLIIQQSGNYFIYAQLYRERTVRESITLMLYKDHDILLHKAVGHENGTINFARPFSLHKGDKLYCTRNSHEDIVLRSQTYWGLFKI